MQCRFFLTIIALERYNCHSRHRLVQVLERVVFVERSPSNFYLKEYLDMAKDPKKSKFMQPMKLSEELVAVVGRGPLPRTEVTKKLWAYIKSNKCQDKKNKRNINPDEKLAKVFGAKKTINMFEMTKLVSKHLS